MLGIGLADRGRRRVHTPHGVTELLASAHAGGGLPIRIELEIWRQGGPRARGFFGGHMMEDVEPRAGLLELSNRLNDQVIEDNSEPVVFESDCREGVCGAYGFLVNGVPHGPLDTAPVYRQHLWAFPGVVRFRLEPWRSVIFPVIRDPVVDHTALDELIRAGGTVDVIVGTASDTDDAAQGHLQTEQALDFAACVGRGAYVAACLNGTVAFFAGAKLAHLSLMSQGRIEWGRRARAAAREFDALFGPCSKLSECLPACPTGIPIGAVALLNQEVLHTGPRGATRDDQSPLHKQGRVREFVPQAARLHP